MSLSFPKPRPTKLEKADRVKLREALDRAENDKVKVRSGGRCEAYISTPTTIVQRCAKRAFYVHHRLGGIGVRGRGQSALAENKLHLCNVCHSDIHAHVLVPDGEHFRRLK